MVGWLVGWCRLAKEHQLLVRGFDRLFRLAQGELGPHPSACAGGLGAVARWMAAEVVGYFSCLHEFLDFVVFAKMMIFVANSSLHFLLAYPLRDLSCFAS